MRTIAAHYLFDGKGKFLKNGIVKIENDGTIIDVIDTNGILEESEGIEFYNGIITPGFINAHCHLELSHMKGVIPEKEGLASFIKNVIAYRGSSDDRLIPAISEAIAEMKENGIVAVGDISNREVTFVPKEKSDIYFHTFLECYGVEEPADKMSLNLANGLYEKWKARIPLSVVPHASYSCSPLLLGKIRINQEKRHGIFSIHNQESSSENELFLKKSGILHDGLVKMGMNLESLEYVGLNSVQTISKYFPNDTNKLLIHNTYTSREDITFLFDGFNPETLFWCLCPKSNIYIEETLPDIALFASMNLQCVIGTDSYSSNTSLSILDELKTISQHQPSITLSDMLTWSCNNGAKALSITDRYGSMEIGKRPGINLIYDLDVNNLALLPETKVKVLA
jgi:cytosine/adenosine deaminase-related metal-dependent hydrolase